MFQTWNIFARHGLKCKKDPQMIDINYVDQIIYWMMSLFLVNLQSLTQEAIKWFELSLDKTDQLDCVLFFTDFTLSKLNVDLAARATCLFLWHTDTHMPQQH